MTLKEADTEEFLIPTSYKTPIGSHLSWPFGAKELTQMFSKMPQIEGLKLRFRADHENLPKGKTPLMFPIIAARYSHFRTQFTKLEFDDWSLEVSGVPRSLRARLRKAMTELGFQRMAEWLTRHANISGCEGYLCFEVAWNSETNSLEFQSKDYASPNLSPTKRMNSHERDGTNKES